MGSASTITSTDLDTTRSRSLRREAAIGAVAAAAATPQSGPSAGPPT